MKEKKTDGKMFTVRLPKDLWLFLKQKSAEQEESMQNIIIRCVGKYKNKFEKRFTADDTLI